MNKFKPVLSICIPCYKRINQVRNTLNSIYEANSEISMDDYEVILSDNDPEMEVKTLMDEFSDKIKFINNIPIGKAVRASCSYPVVFSPAEYEDMELIDGGIMC